MRFLQKRFGTNFNFNSSAVTNACDDQVDIETVSIRHDEYTTKTILNRMSYVYQKLDSYKPESAAALTLGIKFLKGKNKFNSTFQVKRNKQQVNTLQAFNNT